MATPGGVLSLDLATNLGWAYGRLPAVLMTRAEAEKAKPPKPASGIYRVGKPGAEVGEFLTVFQSWLSGALGTLKPGGLIYELPILPQTTTPATVQKLMGLAGVAQMLAYQSGIPWVRSAQASSIKKHFCGSGRPGKEGVQAACIARGWIFRDDNESDALALWDYAATLYNQERAAK